MKLTANQIENLYAFTRAHEVTWYDLQSELVDHLANGIENQWLKKPDISFQDALDKEFRKFGKSGFSKVIEERKRSLEKKYQALIWKHILDFFTIPKILITFFSTAILVFVVISTDISNEYYLVSMVVIIGLYFITNSIVIHRKSKKQEKITNKKWLLNQLIIRQGSNWGVGLLPFYLFVGLKDAHISSLNTFLIITICFLFVMICILIYIQVIEIPQKAEEYLEETYPEYKLVD